jgi:membrane protein YqaA with SNARE-associated domain
MKPARLLLATALLTASLHVIGSLLCTLAGIKTVEWLWLR